MAQVATSSTAVVVPATDKDGVIRLQNLHASQNVYYAWGKTGAVPTSSSGLRIAAGATADVRMKAAPNGLRLYLVANSTDTPTVAWDYV